MLIPTGFWSYTTSDDTSSRGKLSQLRALLAAELQQQVGREPKVNIFQDVVAIPPGREWERQIEQAIAESSFIIPIITPGFLQSEWCCQEVVLFKEREARLGVRDLVFPIHYVDTEHLDGDDAAQCRDPAVLGFLRTRQWVDFRHLRFRSQESEEVALVLENLAKGVLKALRDVGLAQRRAEEQRRKEAADALRRAEEQRQAEEARQARLAQEQRAREDAERVAEEARQRKAAEAAELAEVRRQKAEAKAAAVAEKERGREADRLARRGGKPRSLPRAVLLTAGVTGIVLLLGMGGWMLLRFQGQKPSSQVTVAAAPVTDVERYEQAASTGDGEAMEKLGTLYRLGNGVPRDFGKASAWYAKAVDVGNVSATFRLGRLYFGGLGVSRDYARAVDLFKKAAAAGAGSAMNALGFMYVTGLGVPRNYAEANDWFEKGVHAGDARAMLSLGYTYALGVGVPQDKAKAQDLFAESRAAFERAAASGDVEAMAALGNIFLSGLGGAQDEAKARSWSEKGAAGGDGNAMYTLGTMYVKQEDFDKAAEWIKKSNAAGSANGTAGLGLLYQFGKGGLREDRAKAHELLEEGAASGSPLGMASLASLYASDTPPDYVKAREWYEKGIAFGGPALDELAKLYDEGLGGPKDEAGARALREKAAAATALNPSASR